MKIQMPNLIIFLSNFFILIQLIGVNLKIFAGKISQVFVKS